jgi:hypothetical protein
MLQTLADIMRVGRAPDQLLEYSDVKLCPNTGEPIELELLPPKIKFLFIIGAVHLILRQASKANFLFRHGQFGK